jgi:myo-inositol catabolism protein IolS
METRHLGKDGPQVSCICFGAWPIGGAMGPVSEQQAIEAVQAAIDVGMTFIDTAESYLTSEVIIGKAIVGRRDKVFLATKVSGKDHSREHIEQALEASFRAMGTDYVDLYQLHSPHPEWPIEDTMGILLRLREQGKIRYIGISNYSAEQTAEAVQYGAIHSSQPRYNMLNREAEESILPTCLENGIGVIPHSVLAKGHLSGRYKPGDTFDASDERSEFASFTAEGMEGVIQVTSRLASWSQDHGRDMIQLAIAWTLAQPSITSPIVGAKSAEQVRHNALAADWKFSDSELAEIDEILGDIVVDR